LAEKAERLKIDRSTIERKVFSSKTKTMGIARKMTRRHVYEKQDVKVKVYLSPIEMEKEDMKIFGIILA